MAKFLSNCIVSFIGDDEAVVVCGTHYAFATSSVLSNDATMQFSYKHGDKFSCHTYELSEEGVKNAIWEWLCTMSRLINVKGDRVLGSKERAEGFF